MNAGTHIQSKPKEFNQMSSLCQNADGNCFLRQHKKGMLMVDGLYETRDHNNITSVLWNAKKPTLGHSEEKAWNADIQFSALSWHWASAYSFLHFCTNMSISGGSCLITLVALNSSQETTTCLHTWRTGLDFSASAIMRSWWKMSKHGWANRQQTSLTQAYKILIPVTTSRSNLVVTMKNGVCWKVA